MEERGPHLYRHYYHIFMIVHEDIPLYMGLHYYHEEMLAWFFGIGLALEKLDREAVEEELFALGISLPEPYPYL